jgi:hypothetical protein
MSTDPERKPASSYFSGTGKTPNAGDKPGQTPVSPVSQRTYSSVAGRTGSGQSAKGQLPFFFPLAMLIVCVFLAFVDLAFLNDVIGQVLNVDQTMSLIVSSGLGLVGLAFMMDLGYREAESRVSATNYVVHYGLWILLGLAIAATRLFAASILELSASDEVDLVSVFGTEVRQVDILFAPIMLLLYLITGLGAKGALHTLMINRGFKQSRDSAKERREQRRREAEEARLKITEQRNEVRETAAAQRTQKMKEAEEKRQAKLRDETEKKEARRKAEKEKFESNQPKAQQERQLKEARRQYFQEVKRYKQLESKFQSRYQRVSNLLAGLEGIDGDMVALMHARDNILGVVDKSESGAQHEVAYLIHARTQEPIADLKAAIAAHNARRSSDG